MPQIQISIYYPNVSKLPDESVDDRVDTMTAFVDQAAQDKAEIFLAPEYFFTHNPAAIANPGSGGCIAYNHEEFEHLQDRLSALSKIYPQILIVAGSVFWRSTSTSAYNTSIVYLAGKVLAENQKDSAAADHTFAKNCKLVFEGGESGTAFDFAENSCYLQICTDTLIPPPVRQIVDLSIVPAYMPGAAAIANIKKYRARILSDGSGRYLILVNGKGPQQGGAPGEYMTTLLEF